MKQYIKIYLENNAYEYIKLLVAFIISTVVAIIVINNSSTLQKEKIKEYIDLKIESVKSTEKFNNNEIFKNSIQKNLKDFILVVLLAPSIIGIPIAYLIMMKKAFSISYTVSAIFATQSTKTSIIFICNSLLFHNIIYMISIFLVLASGINFTKSILKKNKKNIKFERIKYLIFICIALCILVISAFFEAYISTNFCYVIKKYL